MQKTHSLTIAIPAYNEAGSIEAVVTGALRAAKSMAKSWEILVVNDGSTDRTGAILTRLSRRYANIRVITHSVNQGFSGAIKSCYTQAKKDLIFLLPADGQIKAADCARFLKHIPHADVVVGYRANNPEPLTRKLNSWVFHTLYRTLFGVKLKEISTSILWKKRVLDTIRITAMPRSALIEPEVVYKAWSSGARFAQVAIPYYPRKSGTPKGSSPLMIILTIQELVRLWWTSRILARA